MTFNEVMALIMPSFIALLYYLKIRNSSIKVLDGICHLAFFILSINSICYIILILLKKDPMIFNMSFTVKYCILAVCIAILLVTIYRFIELNVKMKIKVDSVYEKENK
ncbi:hypothetical protein [Ferdinandcohnia sp. Marseille-Q9671]